VTEDPESLAQRAALGDEAAVEQLITLHLAALRAYVRSHMSPELRVHESCSDVVQSVCRELLTHKERFKYPGADAFKYWLFTTARRKISNRARDLGAKKRVAARLEGGELRESALGEVYGRISSPSGPALRQEGIDRLEQAIDQLSAEQREVLTLAYMAGISRAEIGRRTNQSEEAVRAMLRRTLAKLSILLGDDAGG
jgi:RNA polymerase sigma-70 factor (ECF subfamily)